MSGIRSSIYDVSKSEGCSQPSQMFSVTSGFSMLEERGKLRVETADFGAVGARVSRVTSTGHLVDLTEHVHVTLLLPQSGQVKSQVAAKDFRVTAGSAVLFAPNSRRTRVERPQVGSFQALVLMVQQARVVELLDIAARDGKPRVSVPDALAISGTNPHIRRLSAFLACVADFHGSKNLEISPRAVGAAQVLLEEMLGDFLADLHDGLGGGSHNTSALAKVRQAEEIMREHCDEHLSMAALAQELGVGLRSLQLAFQQVRAAGPRVVLNRMRLDRARARLLDSAEDARVTTIALDCGFAHLSRFAQTYRETYGETPSETLAHQKRRAN
ncbi:helix-turn-helix transcriptional regulator [Rhodobacter ferrooxidans]|uniref:Transcriptional regulator, AraC family n=1 Tax=Rhodobacter ferrooxidans TaxID=371731 RepID=C8S415_9RHOB|nr:helix-turn-helix transcriptional regulator [Rhodobacter sp. SW2]EEW24277.1 transcriptional regulator, AraC family [Rhodobacter sp. SW2]